jgi:hypothetical protein
VPKRHHRRHAQKTESSSTNSQEAPKNN